MAESTALSPRSVTTESRLTGRKVRISKAEKWARIARRKVKPEVRCVFDVECDWHYRKSPIDVKVKKANKISSRLYKGEDRVVITEELYELTAEEIRDDKQLSLALAIFFSLSFVGQNYQEALDQIYTKALVHDDPNKIIASMKWALQFLEHIEHLKGLHRVPDRRNPPKGLTVTDEDGNELVSPT